MNTSKTELSMNELEMANGGGLISNRFNPYNTPGLKLPKRKDQE